MGVVVRRPCTSQEVPESPWGWQDAAGHTKSWTQGWQVTPKAPVWALSLACSWSGCSGVPTLQPTLASSQEDAQGVPPGHPPAPGLSRARQSTDQKPHIHLCTVQQPPSITSRCFSPFPNISRAAVGQPKRCLLLAKYPQQTPEFNRDERHLCRGTHAATVPPPCPEPQRTSTAGRCWGGGIQCFHPDIEGFGHRGNVSRFSGREASWPFALTTAVQGFLQRTPTRTHFSPSFPPAPRVIPNNLLPGKQGG